GRKAAVICLPPPVTPTALCAEVVSSAKDRISLANIIARVSTATGRFNVRCGNDAPVEVQYFLARRAIRAHAEERLPVDTAPQEAGCTVGTRAVPDERAADHDGP